MTLNPPHPGLRSDFCITAYSLGVAELQFVFDLPHGDKKIYGLLQAGNDPDGPVVVFVHGFGSHMREKAIRFNAFAVVEAGFTALRLNLYGEEADARKLIECTVDIHVDDITAVLQEIRASGRRIGVVGHSLGGLIIDRLDHSLFDVAVLWDPVDTETDDFAKWPDMTFAPTVGNWLLDWTSSLAVTTAFHDSWWNGKPDRHDLESPTLVVCAGASNLQQECKRYADAQSMRSALVTIDEADHLFTSREATERLYAETTAWLTSHL